MTNFFGSVMETIHTDSAYKAFSTERATIKKPVDESDHDIRRTLSSSDDQEQTSDSNTKVSAHSCQMFAIRKVYS